MHDDYRRLWTLRALRIAVSISFGCFHSAQDASNFFNSTRSNTRKSRWEETRETSEITLGRRSDGLLRPDLAGTGRGQGFDRHFDADQVLRALDRRRQQSRQDAAGHGLH